MSKTLDTMRQWSKHYRALADAGDITKRDDRLVIALLLESQTRVEAMLEDYLNRENVRRAQSQATRAEPI